MRVNQNEPKKHNNELKEAIKLQTAERNHRVGDNAQLVHH